MTRGTKIYQITLLTLSVCLFACKSTKLVKEGEHLLVKNKIEYTDDNKPVPDLKNQLRQDPNRKVLGLFRFHLSVFNAATSKKDSLKNTRKFRTYFRDKVGEPPELVDSVITAKTSNLMQQYLVSKGFLNAIVRDTITYKRKKAKVKYTVDKGQMYIYDSIGYTIFDSKIKSIVTGSNSKRLLNEDNSVDFQVLSKERNRITELLKESGYYYFTKDYISFELDTQAKRNTVSLDIAIVKGKSQLAFRKLDIGKVHFVVEDKDQNIDKNIDTINFKGVEFSINNYPLRPNVLFDYCYIKPGDRYKISTERRTYSGLASLGLFDFVDIKYKLAHDSSKLDVMIKLKAGYRQSFSIEPQAITSDENDFIRNVTYRNYGIANTITWTNKNLFRNAEQLDVSLITSLQAQGKDSTRFFNSFNQSVNATLHFPNTQLFKKFAIKRNYDNVKSFLSISYTYEDNVDFTRKVFPASYTFEFAKKNHTFFFTPIQVSFNRNIIKTNILEDVDPQDSIFVARLFADNLTTNSSLSYIYNGKRTGRRNFFYIRSNIVELGGNLHRLARMAIDGDFSGKSSYSLFKVLYNQYVKSNVDVRFNQNIDKNNAIVYRINLGVGVPYGNSEILPYDKRFFVGGANSLRGWRPRTIGPGGFDASSNPIIGTQLDKTGEMLILANIEYRYTIFKNFLEGAVFTDAGNVWNITETNKTAQGFFSYNNLLSDLAVNGGLGMRFDFQFFMLRLDWGIRFRDPSLPKNNRWILGETINSSWVRSNTLLNLGIGYPF